MKKDTDLKIWITKVYFLQNAMCHLLQFIHKFSICPLRLITRIIYVTYTNVYMYNIPEISILIMSNETYHAKTLVIKIIIRSIYFLRSAYAKYIYFFSLYIYIFVYVFYFTYQFAFKVSLIIQGN